MQLRQILRMLVPPIIPAVMGRMRPVEREYAGAAWPSRPLPSWDDSSSEKVMRRNWPLVEARIAGKKDLTVLPYRSDERDLTAHNMLMTFLYILARASRGKDQLSVLDWGGMLGHYALVARRMLPEVTFDYLVKEQPTNCRLGRELNPTVSFVDSDDECFARRYDVVFASGAVHYVQDWQAMVARLAGAAEGWLVITALPVVYTVPGFVVVQRLWSAGYQSEFYSNVVNHDDLLAEVAKHGFELERELMSWGPVHYRGAPEHPVGAGYLFRRR